MVTMEQQVQYVVCRTLGHAWDEIDDTEWTQNRVFWNRIVCRCLRCTTKRYDGLNAYGDVERRYYVYPDGYSYAKDEVPSRAEFRLMMIGQREGTVTTTRSTNGKRTRKAAKKTTKTTK